MIALACLSAAALSCGKEQEEFKYLIDEFADLKKAVFSAFCLRRISKANVSKYSIAAIPSATERTSLV